MLNTKFMFIFERERKKNYDFFPCVIKKVEGDNK